MSENLESLENFREHYSGDAAPPWIINRPQKDIIEMYDEGIFRGKVLDLGCGNGENAIFLATKGLSVLAIDFTNEALELARQKLSAISIEIFSRVKFEKADALSFETDNKFDVVLDSALFHSLEDKERILYKENIIPKIKDGGKYIILCFSDKTGGDRGPRRISQIELSDIFLSDGRLELESMRETEYENNEEDWHIYANLAIFRKK